MKISWLKRQDVPDEAFQYAVIVSRQARRWLWVRQKSRPTYELPAGRREPGESIEQTAHRELREETGAVDYDLQVVAAFHVGEIVIGGQDVQTNTACGLLCFAEIAEKGPLLPQVEIADVTAWNRVPELLSYPEIQPQLFVYVREWLKTGPCR